MSNRLNRRKYKDNKGKQRLKSWGIEMKREQKRITAKKKSMYLGTRNLEVKNKRIKHNNKSNDS